MNEFLKLAYEAGQSQALHDFNAKYAEMSSTGIGALQLIPVAGTIASPIVAGQQAPEGEGWAQGLGVHGGALTGALAGIPVPIVGPYVGKAVGAGLADKAMRNNPKAWMPTVGGAGLGIAAGGLAGSLAGAGLGGLAGALGGDAATGAAVGSSALGGLGAIGGGILGGMKGHQIGREMVENRAAQEGEGNE